MKLKLFQSTVSSKMLFVCMLILPLYFSSCKKDKIDTSIPDEVIAEEALTLMAQAVDPQTGGFVVHTEYAANLALNNSDPQFCGIKIDAPVTGQYFGLDRTFDYTLNWSRTLACSGSSPASYKQTFTGTNNLIAPSVNFEASLSGDFDITGLDGGSTEVLLNQTYNFIGTQVYTGSDRLITSNVEIHSTGLKVNKTSGQIVAGGIVSINITGTLLSTGGTFAYLGTITFHGNKKATVLIDGGATLELQW